MRNMERALTVIAIAMAAMAAAVVSSVHAQSPPAESLLVRASVDNHRPYLGQQIAYVLRLYQGPGLPPLAGQIRYAPPAFTGFWNSQSIEQEEYSETIDSNEYRVLELRTLLFPSVVGTIAIEPAALTVPTGSSGAPSVFESAPVAVDVRPLPPRAPAGFTGAVGRFSISAEMDSTTGRVNEPVQLTVRVSGLGNFEALPDPAWPEFAGWRVIESPADAASQVVDGQLSGSRTYGIVLVPEEAGELAIPEIPYVHFNPDRDEYVQAATARIVISIADEDGLAASPPLPTGAGAAEQGRTGDEAHQSRPIFPAPVGKGSDRQRGVLGSVGHPAAHPCGRCGLAPKTGGLGGRPRGVPPAECPAGRPGGPGARRGVRG